VPPEQRHLPLHWDDISAVLRLFLANVAANKPWACQAPVCSVMASLPIPVRPAWGSSWKYFDRPYGYRGSGKWERTMAVLQYFIGYYEGQSAESHCRLLNLTGVLFNCARHTIHQVSTLYSRQGLAGVKQDICILDLSENRNEAKIIVVSRRGHLFHRQ
jgi:hypothetical protein